MKKIGLSSFVIFVLCITTLFSADIYVRAMAAGEAAGAAVPDGTRARPFAELWPALERAVRGDVIHITGGVYQGKGGSGSFLVSAPDLTLAGGYSRDFSKRSPFEFMTVLERAFDYRGDATGLPGGILEGKPGSDHSGLVIDGLVLDGRTRNGYLPDGNLNLRASWEGPLAAFSSENIAVRNCVFINPFGNGIYSAWRGPDNEISNCLFINCFYAAIDTRSAQRDSVIRINGNTISFVWAQPNKGGGYGINVGSQGRTIITDNIIMYAEETAVLNGFGNAGTVLRNNLFYECGRGYYKYMDRDGKNLIVWKPEELAGMESNPDSYSLAQAGNNKSSDPGCLPDRNFLDRFVGKKNLGHRYPLAGIAGLLSGAGGARNRDSYVVYESGKNPAGTYAYTEASFAAFKLGFPGLASTSDKPVSFLAYMGKDQTVWFEQIAPRKDYRAVALILPGKKEPTRDLVFGYLLKGTEAERNWDRFFRTRDRYLTGIRIRGRAFYVGDNTYPYPVAVIIDEVLAE